MFDFGDVANKYGIDPEYLRKTAWIESKGNPQARNAGSGASGVFQFIPSTWKQYGNGGDPFDPQANADAMGRFTADNVKTFSNAMGRAPTPSELYMMHQQGAGGALKLLKNPDATVASLGLGNAVSSNGGRPDMTAKDFVSQWDQRYATAGGGPGRAPSGPQGGADLPMEGAQATEGNLPPGMLSNSEQAGPGGLFDWANGGADGNGWSLSNALMGAGGALMSLDPGKQQAAAQMLAMVKQRDRGLSTYQKLSMKRQEERDAAADRQQAIENQRAQQAMEDRAQQQKMLSEDRDIAAKQREEEQNLKLNTAPAAIQKSYDENAKAYNSNNAILDRIDQAAQDAKSGILKVGALDQMESKFNQLSNSTNPEDVKKANALANAIWVKKNAAQSILQANKGVQTEGDAIRAAQLVDVDWTGWNDKTSFQNLKRLRDQLYTTNGSLLDANERAAKRYTASPYSDEVGVQREKYAGRKKIWDDSGADDEDFVYGRGKYAAGGAEKAPQVKSIEDVKSLPSGTVFIDPNGVKRRVP
jgi:hypothetical protein